MGPPYPASDMSQQHPLRGTGYAPPPGPAMTSGQGNASSSVYGYHRQPHESELTQQRLSHHPQPGLRDTQDQHLTPSHQAHSQGSSTNPNSAAHHFHPPPQPQAAHTQLQHHIPPPQMQPQRHDGPQTDPSGVPSSSVKHAVSQQLLIPFSKVDENTGRKYQLDVVQQPRRARMCGFGDKDRRPITPPPCVRLIITDIATGKEIDCNDIDHSMFVLNVDLWNEDGTREVNLVRSSTGSPSISSTTPYSYATLNSSGDNGMAPYPQHVLASSRDAAYNQQQAVGYAPEYSMQPGYGQASPYTPNGSYGPPHQFFPQHQAYRPDQSVPPLPSQSGMSYNRNGSVSGPSYGQEQNPLTRMAMIGGQPQGMFTRNLIGSLAASAFRLSDTEDRIGIWFVLQDLSVRTEGPFRLRFSFVNVGPPDGAPRDVGTSKINKSRAPILACCFSDVFNVYSAKKFPGVCESTPLSKTFATQGIKIPIRKDSNVKGGDDDDYGD